MLNSKIFFIFAVLLAVSLASNLKSGLFQGRPLPSQMLWNKPSPSKYYVHNSLYCNLHNADNFSDSPVSAGNNAGVGVGISNGAVPCYCMMMQALMRAEGASCGCQVHSHPLPEQPITPSHPMRAQKFISSITAIVGRESEKPKFIFSNDRYLLIRLGRNFLNYYYVIV